MLYDDGSARSAYVAGCAGSGVRYVVLTEAPTDYSSRAEARLLRSGRTPLPAVVRTPNLTVYEVPRADADPARAAGVAVDAPSRGSSSRSRGPGTYRLAVRFSRYWQPSAGCCRLAPATA